MKAVIFPQYGTSEILRYCDQPKPVPKEDEVLIKVKASSVNKGDWHIMTGTPFPVRFMVGGPLTPKRNIPGGDVAGVVEAVGPKVEGFEIGDEVFGDISGCGFGGWAEYTCSKTTALAKMPKSMSFEQAATLPMAAVTALQGLRDVAKLSQGNRVLVNGASGGVGMFAVLIARALGAEVTAVCQTSKTAMVQSLNPNHIIDYKKEDFTQNGLKYDLIFDCAGYRDLRVFKNSLADKGMYLLVGGDMASLMRILLFGPFLSRGGLKYKNYLANPNAADLKTLIEMFEEGKLGDLPGKIYALDQAPQAMKNMEDRKIQGKLVIKIES